MKLTPPPNCDYDSDLATWLMRMSVQANKDQNTIEQNGYLCRAGSGGAADTDYYFNLHFVVGVGTYLYINDSNAGMISVTSDYRLKKNIADLDVDALARIAAMRPVTFRWKDSGDGVFVDTGKDVEGFIAHEMQKVVPSTVYGEKDALDAKGRQLNQSFNVMALFATLVKGMQQLIAENDRKTSEIADILKRLDQLEKART